MIYRWADGSYAQGGKYYGADTYKSADDGNHLWAFGMPSLLLVDGLAVAFLSHYNGCKYYRELERHTPTRFFSRVGASFAAVSIVFGCAMVFGYATFGDAAE